MKSEKSNSINMGGPMFRCIVILSLALYVNAAADPVLEQESHFFGIPNLDSLSNQWIVHSVIDTSVASERLDRGFMHPVDIEVLKLSALDYRLILLDAVGRLFTEFRIDQQNGLSADSVYRSTISAESWHSATAMCLMQQGTYFNPSTDRIVVCFKDGGMVGIYQFNPGTHQFTQVQTISNAGISKPVGIFCAFGNFFVTDEATQRIYRTDTSGNIRSSYGGFSGGKRGYRWISDIAGEVEGSIAHLYVSDGLNGRVDHLTSTSTDTIIRLHSQAWAIAQDSSLSAVHECMLVPGVGIVGFDRNYQRLFTWNSRDSLQNATRDSGPLPSLLGLPATPTIHLRQAGGRLVFITAGDSSTYTIRSYHVNSAAFDDPLTPNTLPPEAVTIYRVAATDSLIFHWQSTGAAHYKVYSSLSSTGPYETLVGTTTSPTLTISQPSNTKLFYIVVSSD
jgi:hypothetical protein